MPILHREIIFIIIIINNKKLQETTVFSGRQKLLPSLNLDQKCYGDFKFDALFIESLPKLS